MEKLTNSNTITIDLLNSYNRVTENWLVFLVLLFAIWWFLMIIYRSFSTRYAVSQLRDEISEMRDEMWDIHKNVLTLLDRDDEYEDDDDAEPSNSKGLPVAISLYSPDGQSKVSVRLGD